MKGPPCFWSPWIDSGWCCEGNMGVREYGNTLAAINFGSGRAHRQWRSWRNSTEKFNGESELAWLGLWSRFMEATGEVAWCLRGGGDALGVRAADSAVKSDSATDLHNPGFGARLLEGEGASEAGQWASSVRTGAERGHR
jgi:hypothetical protein